ncbi:MAG: Gfo/Idh/MocA family oxidoreductase [Oscillospiraceae bacterium]
MKYVLIGCGRISDKHIIAAKNNNLDIVGLCDVDINKAIGLKEKYNLENANIYQSFDEMLTSEKPDLVAIAVPSYLHFSYAYLSLEQNCNTIVEKPMSMSVRECDMLIDKSNDKNICLSVCHQNRFNDAVMFAKEKIMSKEIGDILQISANLRWNRDERYYSLSDWRGKWKTDGGILMNQGIHLLDMIYWLTESDVDCIYSCVSNLNHNYIEIDDNVFAFVKFKNNILAQIEVTTNVYDENLEETITIIGTLGTIKLSGKSMNNIAYYNSSKNKKYVNNEYIEVKNDIYGNGHIKLYENFINSIKNKGELMISGTDGKRAVDFANKIYKSNLSNY